MLIINYLLWTLDILMFGLYILYNSFVSVWKCTKQLEHAVLFIKTSESYRHVTNVKFVMQAQIRYFDQEAQKFYQKE